MRHSQVQQLRDSCLVYVGNLGFYTSETQLRDYFRSVGPVKQIIMGLNRLSRKPCGFCFVEFFRPHSALNAVLILNGTELDGQTIKVELDPGFVPGRQYGRGSAGGQVQDDTRRQQVVVAPFMGGLPGPPPPPPPPGYDRRRPPPGGMPPRRRRNEPHRRDEMDFDRRPRRGWRDFDDDDEGRRRRRRDWDDDDFDSGRRRRRLADD